MNAKQSIPLLPVTPDHVVISLDRTAQRKKDELELFGRKVQATFLTTQRTALPQNSSVTTTAFNLLERTNEWPNHFLVDSITSDFVDQFIKELIPQLNNIQLPKASPEQDTPSSKVKVLASLYLDTLVELNHITADAQLPKLRYLIANGIDNNLVSLAKNHNRLKFACSLFLIILITTLALTPLYIHLLKP